VPASVALRCQLQVGPYAFEAAVVDVSLGGMGTLLIYDSQVRLETGMRIEGARIVHAGHQPVTVALEVRHVARVTDKEGRPANRAGCIIHGSRQDLEALVQMFVSDLGGP
jgi:c-di-GMP-binding flagellar brake protein YcgR